MIRYLKFQINECIYLYNLKIKSSVINDMYKEVDVFFLYFIWKPHKDCREKIAQSNGEKNHLMSFSHLCFVINHLQAQCQKNK